MPRRLRHLAVALLSLGLTVNAVPPAAATETEDPRAETYEGNAVDCEELGGGILVSVEPNEKVENVALTYEGGVPGQDHYVTITEVPEGIAVTAIVVKGGPGYHVYVPGEPGVPKSAPWESLRPPLNPGGNLPQISHWFACGEEAPSPTATTEPAPSELTVARPEPSEVAAEQPPVREAVDAPTPTSPSGPTTSNFADATDTPPSPGDEAAPVAAGEEDLASTGFSGGWLIGVGVALLVVGGALLVVARMRRTKDKATS